MLNEHKLNKGSMLKNVILVLKQMALHLLEM
jgi:hypothetical protein